MVTWFGIMAYIHGVKPLTTTFSLYDEVHNKENPSMVYIDVTRPRVRCKWALFKLGLIHDTTIYPLTIYKN